MRKGKTYDYSYLQMIKFSKHTKNADLINSFNKVTVFFKKHSFFYIINNEHDAEKEIRKMTLH